MRALFGMRAGLVPLLFESQQLSRLSQMVEIDVDVAVTDWNDVDEDTLAATEVLITGWGAARLSVAELERMPTLGAIMHAAGSVKNLLDAEVWRRGIHVSSAAAANATPVAEYTLAMILLAGKGALFIADRYRRDGSFIDLPLEYPSVGNYRSTVGLVGASRIGRAVCELLQPFDLDVLIYDPFITETEAQAMGAHLVDLPTLLASSRVVSIHAPDLPETRHLIDRGGLAMMPDGATLINTSRPALVDQTALETHVLTGRLNAVLDVSEPEPLGRGHLLFTLPNVVITPHVAGAVGTELQRLGELIVDEVERYVTGRQARHTITAQQLATSA